MAVLAVAMLAGLNGAKPGRWALFGLTVSWWIGGAVGLLVEADATPLVLGAAEGVRMTVRDRAYTSPIWYTPSN